VWLAGGNGRGLALDRRRTGDKQFPGGDDDEALFTSVYYFNCLQQGNEAIKFSRAMRLLQLTAFTTSGLVSSLFSAVRAVYEKRESR
jgi:hypothetical protein